MEVPAWFRVRAYPHFDRPIGPRRAVPFVERPENVIHHAFLPFIEYDIITPRYSKTTGTVTDKSRVVSYAAHLDSQIYAYYAHVLAELYERRIAGTAIGDAVIAYRRLGRCNIDFAKEVFDYVRGHSPCVALASDVEKFFDRIDHELLKSAWCSLISTKTLPDDHYAVFRSVTRFSTVRRLDLYREFGIGRRRALSLRSPICSPREFRTRVRGRGLINVNRVAFGIPQGSPISAVLSNIYMLDVDERMTAFANRSGAMYRRYCDDILIVCPEDRRQEAEKELQDAIREARLTIHDKKTQVSHFTVMRDDRLSCSPRPLQYLGFLFDGERYLIRSQTLAKYMQRMIAGTRSAKRAAKRANLARQSGRVYRRKLYERFTHLGRRNFPAYAKRAAQIMQDDTIRRQVKRHWRHLHDELKDSP